MGRIVLLAAAVVLAAMMLAPAPVRAEGARCDEGVVCLPPVRLLVRPPAPDIYILNRDRLEYRRTQAQADFRQEIIDSVRRLPH